MIVRKTAGWLDERLGTNAIVNVALRKIYPDHWSFYLGEFALYFFMVLVGTGIWLTFAFDASPAHAYTSVVALADRAHPIGYVIRQVHHWAAVCFIAAILVHMGRIFFTGAFRKPRELNWMLGLTMLVLAVFTGLTGYSLPNDGLSGTGMRITISVAMSIPVIGRWAAGVFNGGDDFPGPLLTTHLYTLHVYYLPILITGLLAAHLGLLVYQKHTQFVRDPEHVVGRRFWPDYALRTIAVLAATLAALAMLAAFCEINSIADYGEYRTWIIMNSAVPDWYTAFLDGSLRLGPATEIVLWGHPIPPTFWPGIVLPSLTFAMLLSWPFIEAFFTRDRAAHDVLDLPSQAPPLRMAVGAVLIFEGLLLTIAAGDDQTAATLHIKLETLVWFFRIVLMIGPVIVAVLAVRIARERRARIVDSAAYPSAATTLVRNAEGGFDEEIAEPV